MHEKIARESVCVRGGGEGGRYRCFKINDSIKLK